MEIVAGVITDMDERGIVIRAPYPNIDRAILRRYKEAQIGLPDGRTISPEQRKKAHALIGEIADFVGEAPEGMKRILKLKFIAEELTALEKAIFSLSDCDVTTAKEFISFLIDFILEWGIPTKVPLQELCEDTQQYVYACLMHKKCAVCQKKGELHHYDTIGMGSDRTEKYQIGMKVISLCREHHTEAHSKGKSWLIQDMHLVPIPLTKEIGKVYRLTKKNLEG